MKIAIVFLAAAASCLARSPWTTPTRQWTEEDARQILYDSPWAKGVSGSKARIRWESARPIRLALEKLNLIRPGDEDCQPCYAVAVVDMPKDSINASSQATLTATGRRAITASAIRIRDFGVLFIFPRDPELREPVCFRLPVGVTIGNDVEFAARIGTWTVKRKFRLRSMTYDGSLEL